MLDTVAMIIPRDKFQITDPDLFTPSARRLLQLFRPEKGDIFMKCVQNPSPSEIKLGRYKPRLTLMKRYNHIGVYETTLKIELSLPKLVFNNNFDELVNDDIGQIASKLLLRLKEMGVLIKESDLLNATISTIHYSKNIPLLDGTTPHYMIGKIKQANIKLSLDVNQTDYRNDGTSYKWHANTYEVSFYDKIKDLQTAKKSEKRSIESDYGLQLGLLPSFEKRNQLEVLRYEVRLNTRQKIRQIMKKLGIISDLTLGNMVDQDIAKRVLIHHLDELESRRLPLMDYKSRSAKAMLATIITENPEIGMRKAIQLLGLKTAMDNLDARELRAMFPTKSKTSWYRLVAEAKKMKLPNQPSPFQMVRQNIEEMKPLRLVDFQDRMLNNDKYN